jgi:hypothetical protein
MTTYSYSDLTLTPAGLVYQNDQALRLCIYAGQTLLAVGTPEAVEFYDAAGIIRGLHGNASEFDLPLPEPVPVDAMQQLNDVDQRFMREFVLGAEQNYLKGTVPTGHPDLILDKAKSLGLVVQKASTVKLLEAEIREQTTAEMRARVLTDKANDLIRDYVAEPLPPSTLPDIPTGVVHKLDPAVYERILRNTGGYTPATTRVKWPFNTMQVGDCVYIDAKLAKRAQTAVHVYAARMGRTFKTTTHKVTKVLQVVRVEDKTE